VGWISLSTRATCNNRRNLGAGTTRRAPVAGSVGMSHVNASVTEEAADLADQVIQDAGDRTFLRES
jgi:hypothetical protein